MSLEVEGLTIVGTCECGRTLAPQRQWQALSVTERAILMRHGYTRHGARGLCVRCYQRHAYSDTLIDHARRTLSWVDVLDAMEVDPQGADESRRAYCLRLAPRLGMTYAALSQAMRRNAPLRESA